MTRDEYNQRMLDNMRRRAERAEKHRDSARQSLLAVRETCAEHGYKPEHFTGFKVVAVDRILDAAKKADDILDNEKVQP